MSQSFDPQARRRQADTVKALVMAGLALCLLGGIILYFYSYANRQKAIAAWVNGYPANALVLKAHPDTRTLFEKHFGFYYDRSGQDGLARGQLEMQQIINMNYLIDYIWSVKDDDIRRFVTAQLALLERLAKLQQNKPGLCERYYADSVLFEEVEQAAGGRLFLDFMLASEKLLLSAEDGQDYKMTPKHPNYRAAVTEARRSFWETFTAANPGLSTEQLQQAVHLFNPTVSCAGYASYLRTLLNMNQSFMPLYWRDGQEQGRAAAEAARKARGAE